MTRTEDDSWDLASSVGVTASMVATARAVATRQPNPLINDPYAEVLVHAAGVDFFSRLACGCLEYDEVGPAWLADFFGVRALFFDDFLPDAVSGCIRQVVIVGSGLDSRAYRLHWPSGTVVYEIDQPKVIKFKTTTLAGAGAKPRAELRTVGTDLRQDWPTALRDAGFDPGAPTAWILEGLMIGYLPGEAQDRLLRRITALSAAGSRLAADHLPADSPSLGSLVYEATQGWKQYGFDIDFGTITYPHDRNNADEALRADGWSVIEHTITDLLTAAQLTTHSLETGPDRHGAIKYLTATRL
jgi:methyltransferase (TIGR00027 family)